MLVLAAERTDHIGLGPGVLVPTLRHPMVTASGAATLAAFAPGRVALAFGTGFSGTLALGAPPATWSYLRTYIQAVRGLLRGDTVEWDGAPMRMLHPGANAPQRPIEVPVLVSALGPKGLAVTREIADGLFSVSGETAHAREFTWAALGIHGTVLSEDETLNSPRLRAAAGPGNALAYHLAYEFGGDPTNLPGGQAWLDAVNAHPRAERHFAVHEQHLTDLNAADNAAWNEGSWQAITSTTVTGPPGRIRDRLSAYARDGITEIVYQPTGPDIPGELERFIAIARDV
jgi:5,10-methylenetetrahydromethanopterin reductase